MRMKLISGETLEEELGGGRANVRLNHAGIARNAHVAPAKLRASSPPRGGDESGDAPADAAAKKPKPKSALWQRALVAAVAEAHVDDWVDVRSDEDDASVEWNGSDRDDDDDDDDDDVEDAEEENSELAPGELPRFLAPRPPTTRRGIERALIRAVPRKRATDDDAEGFTTIHSVDWSHQNLSRVPPKLPSSPHRAKNLRAIDVSHNFIAKLPSSLARFTRLERIDASDNRLATLPAALGRCLRLKALIVSRNDLRDLGGTWIAELPELTRLDLDGNDRLREPPPFVADMGLRAVREYLRATRLVRDWDEDDVTVFDRRATGGELSAALRIARCDARARLEGRDEDEEAAACRRDARGGERPPDLRYVAHKARSIHWSPYDRVGVVNAVS